MDLEKFFEEDEQDQEFNFDFRRYLRGIYKRKWIVLGLFLLILIPWMLYIQSKPPEYEAYTWIRFKYYDAEKLKWLNKSRYIELTSRTFAEKVVAELGLTLDISKKMKKSGFTRGDVFTKVRTTYDPHPGEYILTFEDNRFSLSRVVNEDGLTEEVASGDLSEIANQVFSINGFSIQLKPKILEATKTIHFNVMRFRDAVKWFRSTIQVSMAEGGSLMQLRMVHDDPVVAAEMVNRLADIFIDESISFEKKSEKIYRETIQARLKLAKEKLDQDQEKLRKFQETHFINLDTDIENKVEQLSTLQSDRQKFQEHKKTINDLLAKLGDFGQKTITPGKEDTEIRYIYRQIVKNDLFKDDAEMGILAQQLELAEKNRQDLLDQNVNITFHGVVDIDKKIAETQLKIYKRAVTVVLDVEDKLKEIDSEIYRLNREIKNLPSEKLKLANLQKQVEISQKLYADLLQRSQELSLTEASETEEISVLDRAIPPELPVNRGKKKMAVLGFLFALFTSIGVAVVLEFMDKTIKSPDDIKRYLKLDVIGTIPKVEFEDEFELKDSEKLKRIDSQLVTYDYSPTPVGEAYRALRTKIVFSKKTGKVRTIVITSFAPGDGKSFTSSNLAITLAQHKANTLLIDSDLRRGVLHNTFNIPKEPGLSNYLMGMVRFEEILNETYIPNLTLISCGTMMPNPSELLGSARLQQFIREAKQHFDVIIFDSPPLNAATDAVVLGTQTDGVALIVRAEVTNRNVAKQKLTLFEGVPATILGVVLNATDADLAHEGYSYYHY